MKGSWRELLLRRGEREDGTGVPEVGGRKDTHQPATLPGSVAGREALCLRASVRSRLSRPTRASGEHGRASRAGARSAVPPPEPDTSALGLTPRPGHSCKGPDLRVVALGAGASGPAPPLRGRCSGTPPRPPLPLGAGPVKHRVSRAPLPRSGRQARFAVAGRVLRGLRGRGAWVPGSRPLLRCSEPHGERPLGRVGPQMLRGPGVAEGGPGPKSNTAARRQPEQ